MFTYLRYFGNNGEDTLQIGWPRPPLPHFGSNPGLRLIRSGFRIVQQLCLPHTESFKQQTFSGLFGQMMTYATKLTVAAARAGIFIFGTTTLINCRGPPASSRHPPDYNYYAGASPATAAPYPTDSLKFCVSALLLAQSCCGICEKPSHTV